MEILGCAKLDIRNIPSNGLSNEWEAYSRIFVEKVFRGEKSGLPKIEGG